MTADLHDHLDTLRANGLLIEVDAPVNKDTVLHPLVRWQYCGGIDEADRKGFLFTNVVDGNGRSFDIDVAVGVMAGNPAIYSVGMAVPVEEIGRTWLSALAEPIAPTEVTEAPCQEVVITGDDLLIDGNGLDGLPIPVSTPGYDAAPYHRRLLDHQRPRQWHPEHGHLPGQPEVTHPDRGDDGARHVGRRLGALEEISRSRRAHAGGGGAGGAAGGGVLRTPEARPWTPTNSGSPAHWPEHRSRWCAGSRWTCWSRRTPK